jgi:HepT-like protein
MIEKAKILVLISEVEKAQSVLQRLDSFYADYLRRTDDAKAHLPEQAIVISDLMANAYTCLETVFLRISRCFENSLSQERWHQDLLRKMTLEIPGVRQPVISDAAAPLLLELLRFRHFKRYYFELEYDWDRIDFVRKKYAQLKPLLQSDFERFMRFLREL